MAATPITTCLWKLLQYLSGQLTIFPKPQLRAFGGIPLWTITIWGDLGWGCYNLPCRSISINIYLFHSISLLKSTVSKQRTSAAINICNFPHCPDAFVLECTEQNFFDGNMPWMTYVSCFLGATTLSCFKIHWSWQFRDFFFERCHAPSEFFKEKFRNRVVGVNPCQGVSHRPKLKKWNPAQLAYRQTLDCPTILSEIGPAN